MPPDAPSPRTAPSVPTRPRTSSRVCAGPSTPANGFTTRSTWNWPCARMPRLRHWTMDLRRQHTPSPTHCCDPAPARLRFAWWSRGRRSAYANVLAVSREHVIGAAERQQHDPHRQVVFPSRRGDGMTQRKFQAGPPKAGPATRRGSRSEASLQRAQTHGSTPRRRSPATRNAAGRPLSASISTAQSSSSRATTYPDRRSSPRRCRRTHSAGSSSHACPVSSIPPSAASMSSQRLSSSRPR